MEGHFRRPVDRDRHCARIASHTGHACTGTHVHTYDDATRVVSIHVLHSIRTRIHQHQHTAKNSARMLQTWNSAMAVDWWRGGEVYVPNGAGHVPIGQEVP